MRHLLLLLVLIGFACSRAGSGAPIRTDRQRYSPAAEELSIQTVYTNSTDRTVDLSLSGCSAPVFSVEKEDGGQWIPAGGPICPAIYYPPIPVAPGARYADTLRLHVEHLQAAAPPGTYRLVYEIRVPVEGSDLPGELLPRDARVSNPFVITR